jgi:hypothetical protein
MKTYLNLCEHISRMQATKAGKTLQIYSSFTPLGICGGSVCTANMSYRIFLTKDKQPLPDNILKGKEGQTWQFVSRSELPKMRTPRLAKDGFLELATLNFIVDPAYAILPHDKSAKKQMRSSLWPRMMLLILNNLEEITGKIIKQIALPKKEDFEVLHVKDLRKQLERLIAQKPAN